MFYRQFAGTHSNIMPVKLVLNIIFWQRKFQRLVQFAVICKYFRKKATGIRKVIHRNHQS